jgi:hypothetical protein
MNDALRGVNHRGGREHAHAKNAKTITAPVVDPVAGTGLCPESRIGLEWLRGAIGAVQVS